MKTGLAELALTNPRDAGERLLEYSGFFYLKSFILAAGQPNAAFIWIPKTAGTSVCLALGDIPRLISLRLVKYRFADRGIVTFGHMDYAMLVSRGRISSRFDTNAYKFSFSRNPYDRAVSLYAYLKHRRNKVPGDWTFLDFCRRISDGDIHPIGVYNVRVFSQCNPQVRWIENISMDYIGKQENLESEIETIASRLGIENRGLTRANESPRSHYIEYYCEESRDIVQHFYREDFEYFGYDKELTVEKTRSVPEASAADH